MAEGLVAEPAFVHTLTDALKKRLPGADIHHEHVRRDRYRFVVVWPGFDPMDHPERQQIVWDLAEQVLPGTELLNVSMILTMGLDDLPKE